VDDGMIGAMKKTFNLKVEGKNADRVLEATKHEIRQYAKRERNKPLPAGVDFWDFDCKFGAEESSASILHFAAITQAIDALVAAGGTSFYLEILAKPGVRVPRPPFEEPDTP
jgi:tRNA A37 N6-isopentenylltransferase MiaA